MGFVHRLTLATIIRTEMKQLTILVLLIFVGLLDITAQNPLTLLKDYQYDTNNNELDFENELSQNHEDLSYTNIFFHYYKNHAYNDTFDPYKMMLFRINYEHLIQITLNDSSKLEYTFPIQNGEKVVNKKVYIAKEKKGELTQVKLQSKLYKSSISDSTVSFELNKEGLSTNDIIRIYWKTETHNFDYIWIPQIYTKSNFVNYVSLSLPEIFKFNLITEYLEIIESNKSDAMQLKQFSYDVSRLVENINVSNVTYKWKQINNDHDLFLPILSINLPTRIGTSAEEIIQN